MPLLFCPHRQTIPHRWPLSGVTCVSMSGPACRGGHWQPLDPGQLGGGGSQEPPGARGRQTGCSEAPGESVVAPLPGGQWQLEDSHPCPSACSRAGGRAGVCLGVERGPHMWEGPQGEGAQGQVLGSSRHRPKASSAAWALDWLGVKGEDQEAALSLSEERASGRRGRGLTQPDSPGCTLFGQRLSWESGGQEAQGKEASLCGAKNRGAEALPLPKPESPDHSIRGVPRRKERGHSCLPGAGQGPSCLP